LFGGISPPAWRAISSKNDKPFVAFSQGRIATEPTAVFVENNPRVFTEVDNSINKKLEV
jgi:hypothetical protein